MGPFSAKFLTLLSLFLFVLIIQCFSLPKGRPDGHDLIELTRTKRYIGRVPVAYMKKSSGSAASHFRERHPESTLTDEELENLLYIIENYQQGYVPQTQPQTQQLTTEELERLAQLLNVRKRETGKKREVEEPLEFLRQNYGRLEKVKKLGGPGTYYIPKSRSKKEIDWSEYWGVDKRSAPMEKAVKEVKGKEEKQENLTTDKETPDKEWLMHEYFKNLAFSSSVRRKRSEADKQPSAIDNLSELEGQMEKVGDKLIWDALKFTGAHKDAELSPEEKEKVKGKLIKQLATAYSLEKVREGVDQLRQNLVNLEE